MWQTETLKAGKYGVMDEKKARQTERERQNKNKVDLNHWVIPRVLCAISGWKIFFFFEYVPSCKMSQLETLSQRDIKVLILHNKISDTKVFMSALQSLSFLWHPFYSADGLLLQRCQNQHGRSDLVVFATSRLSILHKNGRNQTCLNRHLIKRK